MECGREAAALVAGDWSQTATAPSNRHNVAAARLLLQFPRQMDIVVHDL
jgi:hypothetical protein